MEKLLKSYIKALAIRSEKAWWQKIKQYFNKFFISGHGVAKTGFYSVSVLATGWPEMEKLLKYCTISCHIIIS